MSDTLLLLHNRYSYSALDIEKVAKLRGWTVVRINDFNVAEVIAKFPVHKVIYYGDTIQLPRILPQLPITPYNLSQQLLSSLPEISKRQVTSCAFWQLIQPFNQEMFCKPFGDKFFEAKVYHIGQTIELDHQDFIPSKGRENDLVQLSPRIEITNEVRCFCLNGEILTSSWYRIEGKVVMGNCENVLDEFLIRELRGYVKKIYETYSYEFPPGTVLDFAWSKELGWFLLEQNQAWASSIYSCNPEKCLDVVAASWQTK